VIQFKLLSTSRALRWAASLCIIALGGAHAETSQAQSTVQLTTDPPLSKVVPFEAEAKSFLGSGQFRQPIQLTLQVLDQRGVKQKDAKVHLRILNPPPTPWFTTDFPAVEGTTLLDIGGNAPTGAFRVQQALPIRGTYRLEVDVAPNGSGAFLPFRQILALNVQENPQKLFVFLVTLGVLSLMGILGGWVIGSRQSAQPGEMAPYQVRQLLSIVTLLAILALLFFSIQAELFHQHRGLESDPTPRFTESQGLKLEVTGNQAAQVGRLTSWQARLTNLKTHQPVSEAIFSIRAIQLEDQWATFSYQGRPDREGTFRWQAQFFDGAPHRVEVVASPSPAAKQKFQLLRAAQEVEVETEEPPISVRVIGLSYLTGAVALGTLLGLGLQHRRRQKMKAKAA
jgi:hypothetical protein